MTMLRRNIPGSGETLPVIGCGTWSVFDVGTAAAERDSLGQVLSALFDAGGSVIDSSPMYGRAEGVVGSVLDAIAAHDRAFIATKVWTRGKSAGIDQMRRSARLLGSPIVDLMQVHNLLDWREHLATLREWKREGLVRYIGITHYTASAYEELEAVMRAESLDFVQLNYSLDERDAEMRLLPLAQERGMAVLVNRPLGGGGLIASLKNRGLPDWAGELGCTSWAQICLKYLLAHPAVTCVIPATGNVSHMRDNVLAGSGPLPDEAMRSRIAAAARGR